jgi:hypothetical protein
MATRAAAFTATFLAWDTLANAPKTGDTANITPRILKDGTSAALTVATVTEADATNLKGLYKVAVNATEADFAQIVVGGFSSTSDVEIIPTTYQMERLPDAAPDEAGGLPVSDAGGLDIDNRMLDAGTVTNLNTIYDGVEGFAGAYAGPRGPGVYYNDAAANTNTVNGTDGTWNNHVSTPATAKTIADSLGIDRIYLVKNSSFTVPAAMEDYEFFGIGEMMANTIVLNSQDVDNSYFENVLITGDQGGTGRMQAEGCVLLSITSMEITALRPILAAGTLTLRNDCAFDFWSSAVSGGGTPIINIDSVANVNTYFRHGSGGLQVNNAVATTVMSVETDGQLIIDATCTGLTIVPRGNLSITDNGTSTSLDRDAAISRTGLLGADSTLPATTFFSGVTDLGEWLGLMAGKQVGDATARTEIRATGAGSGTYDETTDSLEAALDSQDHGGTGADAVTINLDAAGDDLADADVWISNDSAGTNVIAGTLQSDSNGNVTFQLDAGNTYYLWVQKDGVKSIQGTQFVAVAD